MRLMFAFLLLAQVLGEQKEKYDPSDVIDEDDVAVYLAEHNGCEPDQIHVWKMDQHDFLRKGYAQIAVEASTCMTGTAGPDVHSVFTRNEHGELKELAKEEVKLDHQVLFGNRNSQFRIENDLLVEVYYDTSDRDDPLVVKYKWDKAKDQFVIVSVEAAKPYRTSYDCVKAEKAENETEQAICYVESLADLDVELAGTYKTYLAGLPASSRKAAIEEQRGWIAERNRGCTIYKSWVECLEEKYKTRITELKKKLEEQKKQSLPRPSD
jgi:uncharacterized protein YecT (DUF1311 family)